MTKTSAAAVFFLIWWVVLFAVLPWGVRSQHEGGEVTPGTDPGAPVAPKLGRKLIWTTLVASVVFAAVYVAFTDQLVTIDQLMGTFGLHFKE
jgi:predicted secreted protein